MKHEQAVLENGLRVIVVPMPHVRSLTITAAVGVGSRYESDRIAGISHLLEHMLFKGTERRPSAARLSDEVESLGGVMNASTDKEMTVFWIKIPVERATQGMDLIADVVMHSRLRPQDVAREKAVVQEELRMLQDDPQEMSGVLADAVLWPFQPAGREVAGTSESVAGLRPRDLRAHMGKFYGANNAVVSVAGGLSAHDAVRLVQEALGRWELVEAPRPLPAAFVRDAPRVMLDYRPILQTHVSLTFPAIPRDHPDRYAVDVLSTILGGGTSSRLFVQLRERLALVYDVGVYPTYLTDTGALTVFAAMDGAKVTGAIERIFGEIERLQARRVNRSELERAQNSMRGRLWLGLEDTYSVASWYGVQDLLRDALVTPGEAADAIGRVTAGDILRAARLYLDPAEARVTAVGPVRDLNLESQRLGA